MMFAVALLATSCDDWLDVRGENISKENDQFENYKGFRDALTGCYMAMGDVDAYGKRLTMTDVECLADLWYVEDSYETQAPLKYYLSHHDYANDYSRPAIKAIYAKLFHIVASANVLLKNIAENGATSPTRRLVPSLRARHTPSVPTASSTSCASSASYPREPQSKCRCPIPILLV